MPIHLGDPLDLRDWYSHHTSGTIVSTGGGQTVLLCPTCGVVATVDAIDAGLPACREGCKEVHLANAGV